MFAPSDLTELPSSARTAIENATQRVERASQADDVEQIIGTSKELIETVAKVAISALGGTYGSSARMSNLAHDTLAALDMDPAKLGDRPALRELASALFSAAMAVAELRNTDGTGHGTAVPSNLDASHARFACEAAIAWCRWVLAATHRALRDRVPIAEVVNDISERLTFSQGKLPALLQDIRVHDRSEDDQFKLGLVVARRWTVNETFMPREDVIRPLAAGDADYPPAFAEGVLEGLLLDYNGFLRINSMDVPLVVGIADRLPGDRRKRVYDDVVAKIGDALLSYAFKEEEQVEVIQELRTAGAERAGSPLDHLLETIASRIESLRRSGGEPFEND